MRYESVQHLCELLSDRLEEFLEYLDVNFKREGKYYIGKCPVHDGNNPRACVIYPKGGFIDCTWKCLTKHCASQNAYGGQIFGFVRGVYEQQKSIKLSKQESIVVVQKFLRITDKDLNTVGRKYKAFQFLNCIDISNNTQKHLNFTREQLRQHLIIPSPSFLSRGFTSEILDKYDIGDSHNNGKAFSNRTIIPIYDTQYNKVLGFQARTIFDDYEQKGIHKWQTMKGFSCNLYLFNYWFATPHILEKKNSYSSRKRR
jgi:hypothetical protein